MPRLLPRRLIVLRLGALYALLGASRAAAQGQFAGVWVVRTGRPAPWVDAADAPHAVPERTLLGRRVTFAPRRVTGPDVLACAGAAYEQRDVPFDQLFEGSLRHPAADATALGFRGAVVRTLIPGCEIEFHLVRPDTALFALNNVIYTLVRAPAARR